MKLWYCSDSNLPIDSNNLTFIMKTLKTILKFIGLFILIKCVFFAINHFSGKNEISSISDAHSLENNSQLKPHLGFHRIMVGYGLSVEIPESWHILSNAQVQKIKNTASQIDNNQNKTTSLAANSSEDPKRNESVFRVSFTDANFTENDLIHASSADIAEVCTVMNKSLGDSLPQAGTSLTKAATCRVGKLANLPAFISEYERQSVNKDGNWKVTIYQIPLNSKMAIVTASYSLNSEVAYQAISSTIKSISITNNFK